MAIFLGLTILAAALWMSTLIPGTIYQIRLSTTPPGQLAVFGRENDIILLKGRINAFRYSTVNVEQCADDADEHTANIYLIKSDNVKQKSVETNFSAEPHYQDLPSQKSGLIDYLYLLPSSNFTYIVCLSSTTIYNQNATYYLISGVTNYTQYIHDPNNGRKYSLYSTNLTAIRNNRTNCTRISYRVSSASYYFMMFDSPGNIMYSYNFSLQKFEYSISDIEIECNVSKSKTCPVKLLSRKPLQQTRFDIFARIQPYFGEQSTTSYLCLSKFVTSAQNKIWAAVFLSLGGLCTVCSLIFIVLLVCTCKKYCAKRQLLYPTQSCSYVLCI